MTLNVAFAPVPPVTEIGFVGKVVYALPPDNIVADVITLPDIPVTVRDPADVNVPPTSDRISLLLYPVPPDTSDIAPTNIVAFAVAVTPPVPVGAEMTTDGILVYAEPAAVLVIAVTVVPLLALIPEEPATKSIAPAPLVCNASDISVLVPLTENVGPEFAIAPVTVP